MFALIQNGVVWELSPVREVWTSEQDVRDVRGVPGLAEGWLAKEDGSYEAPEETPTTVVIPAVSRAQGKIQLRRAGLRDKVEDLIAKADPEVQDWYAEAGTWQRANPHVVDIVKALGLTPAQGDDLFLSASLIEA